MNEPHSSPASRTDDQEPMSGSPATMSTPGTAELHTSRPAADPAVAGAVFHGGQCACEDCLSYDLDGEYDDGSDMDPCNYCPHDNTDHRGDGCLYCGCVASQ